MFKRHYPIHDQIKVFLGYRIRQGSRDGTYNFWLEQFVEMTGVEDVYDIEQEDVDSYLTSISVLYNGQFALNEAETAVRVLRRYYRARGQNVTQKVIHRVGVAK